MKESKRPSTSGLIRPSHRITSVTEDGIFDGGKMIQVAR